jgi:hypothetical protein
MDRLIQLIPAAIGGGGLPTAFYALDVSGVIWYGTARAGAGTVVVEWIQVKSVEAEKPN